MQFSSRVIVTLLVQRKAFGLTGISGQVEVKWWSETTWQSRASPIWGRVKKNTFQRWNVFPPSALGEIKSPFFFLSLEANAWQAHITTWSLRVKTTLCSFPTLTWPYQNPFLWLTDLQWRWGCHWQQCTSASNYPPNTAEYICALILFGLSGTSAVMTTRPTRELAFYTQARGVDVGVWNIAHLCSCKRVKRRQAQLALYSASL